ncbi:MAG: tRNA pseudouridine(55) synthase TruB [Bacillota bacterium]
MDGIIVLNKQAGDSSNKALQLIKKLFPGHKAGHTGTLDPMATGVLPICLGRATRLSEYIIELPKSYRAEVTFGKVSTTGDSEGEITDKYCKRLPDRFKIKEMLHSFKGEIEQLPPLYSAVKHQGKPLYHWARRGVEVPRRLRKAFIYRIDLLFYDSGSEPQLIFEVDCSRGTYIRSLAMDIGEHAGCGAYLSGLVRTAVGPYNLKDALSPDQVAEYVDRGLADRILWPMDTALQQFPAIELSNEQVEALKNGLELFSDQTGSLSELPLDKPTRLYDRQGVFKALVARFKMKGEDGLKTLKFLL